MIDVSRPIGISYSGGKSSKWMLYAMLYGMLPRPEHVAVFFADTGEEHAWTYEDVESVAADCAHHGIAFIRCAARESLGDHLLRIEERSARRAETPSLFIEGAGRTMHKCTRYFKVEPMRRAASAWLREIGQPKRLTKWIGFASDEQVRATKAVANSAKGPRWERLDFPAIRLGKTRPQQADDLTRWGVPVPKFSSCTFCPGKTIKRWLDVPASQLARVVQVDEAIRELDQIGLTEGRAYLNRFCVPVADLIREGIKQDELPGFETYCDGGHCFL